MDQQWGMAACKSLAVSLGQMLDLYFLCPIIWPVFSRGLADLINGLLLSPCNRNHTCRQGGVGPPAEEPPPGVAGGPVHR